MFAPEMKCPPVRILLYEKMVLHCILSVLIAWGMSELGWTLFFFLNCIFFTFCVLKVAEKCSGPIFDRLLVPLILAQKCAIKTIRKFRLMPMGAITPGSARSRPSAQSPIDMKGIFSWKGWGCKKCLLTKFFKLFLINFLTISGNSKNFLLLK